MFLMTFADKTTVVLCDDVCTRMMVDACENAQTTTDRITDIKPVELMRAKCHVCWIECGMAVAA